MPNVNVLRSELFTKIGREFSKYFHYIMISAFVLSFYAELLMLIVPVFCIADDDFEDLCFQFGVELEHGSAEEMQMNRVDGDGNAVDLSNEYVYKIEVAANRYDLLCVEGIASAFRVYLGLDTLPRFTVKNS